MLPISGIMAVDPCRPPTGKRCVRSIGIGTRRAEAPLPLPPSHHVEAGSYREGRLATAVAVAPSPRNGADIPALSEPPGVDLRIRATVPQVSPSPC